MARELVRSLLFFSVINIPPLFLLKVKKSFKNFPDSKIFVTKTFRMMRVNCFNFQICDKCAEGCVCKILSIRMVKICPMGYIYNGHYLHLSTFLNTLIENMQNSIQETSRHLFRSSGHFQIIWIHFLDTFQIIQAYFLHYPDNFQIIGKLSRSSGHFPNQPDTFYGLSGHFLDCLNFPDRPETLQIIQTLSRSSRHFPDHPDTAYHLDILCSIWTFPKLSGIFSADNEHIAKTFRVRKNFPVSIANALTEFF